MDWVSLAVGLVVGWIGGVLVGYSLQILDQWNEVVGLLRDHLCHHRRAPRITLTEEDADSEWEKWELN